MHHVIFLQTYLHIYQISCKQHFETGPWLAACGGVYNAYIVSHKLCEAQNLLGPIISKCDKIHLYEDHIHVHIFVKLSNRYNSKL